MFEATRTSVITINKDRDEHLRRLLEGLNHGAPPDEIIVVGMGALGAPHRDRRVLQLPLPGAGLPLALARNSGRRAATGDVLIFLDVDCIPSSGLVSALTASVLAHDAIICCEIFYLTEAVGDQWNEAELAARSIPHPVRAFPAAGIIAAPHPGLFWSLAFGISAGAYDRLGGFDERFSGYGAEDTDLAFRAAAMKIPILFTSGHRAFHQRHRACDPPLNHYGDIVRNARLFRRRHGVWPMRDWLGAFERMGLIAVANDEIVMLREPTQHEIARASVPPERAF